MSHGEPYTLLPIAAKWNFPSREFAKNASAAAAFVAVAAAFVVAAAAVVNVAASGF